MKQKLDIEAMQYMNLFAKFTNVRAKYCFNYNETLVFMVDRYIIGKVLDKKNNNLFKLSQQLNKKIKVVIMPENKNIKELEEFIKIMIYPIKLKKICLNDKDLILVSPSKSKSFLIGKNKRNLKQLSEILNKFFNIRKVSIR